jgi:ADP-ribose pyrophosphatase YjhB (NUDIX family)
MLTPGSGTETESLLVGVAAASLIGWCVASSRYNRLRQSSSVSLVAADDSCQSLFYGEKTSSDGKQTTDTVARLKTVKPQFVRLPSQLYGDIVRNTPTVCVDVLCRRESDGKLLLFLRRDKPAAGLWWWPGGRMLRDESFFDTAVRKVMEETGADATAQIIPRDIISTWNTFFHDSSWDRPGEEGCQTVNITVFCELLGDSQVMFSDRTSANLWAVEASKWVSVDELLRPGMYDKYIRLNVKLAKERCLL